MEFYFKPWATLDWMWRLSRAYEWYAAYRTPLSPSMTVRRKTTQKIDLCQSQHSYLNECATISKNPINLTKISQTKDFDGVNVTHLNVRSCCPHEISWKISEEFPIARQSVYFVNFCSMTKNRQKRHFWSNPTLKRITHFRITGNRFPLRKLFCKILSKHW